MTPESSRPAAERQIPVWAATVGPGWATLLDRLHHDLLALDADYRIDSFGAKFGGLRITVADRFENGEFADRATALTDAAETDSEHTCEACGKPGRIRLRGDGPRVWMQASCEDCRLGAPRPTAASGTGPS